MSYTPFNEYIKVSAHDTKVLIVAELLCIIALSVLFYLLAFTELSTFGRNYLFATHQFIAGLLVFAIYLYMKAFATEKEHPTTLRFVNGTMLYFSVTFLLYTLGCLAYLMQGIWLSKEMLCVMWFIPQATLLIFLALLFYTWSFAREKALGK